MTTNTLTNLEKIRQACIKANPEIMELKCGCRFVDFGKIMTIHQVTNVYVLWSEINGQNGTTNCSREVFEEWRKHTIIGREIRLADVLLALHRKSEFYVVGTSGLIMPKNDTNPNGVEDKWNLADDNLSHQSPETIKFLADLL